MNREILRSRFGFDGVLVSDYAAIKELIPHGYAKDEIDAAKKALIAGVDLDMMTSIYANHLSELVQEPRFMQLLDEAVWRILMLKNKLGLFENPYRGLEEVNTGEILTEKAKEAAVELVEKSCVLLKNNDTLPLVPNQKNCCDRSIRRKSSHFRFLGFSQRKATRYGYFEGRIESPFCDRSLNVC